MNKILCKQNGYLCNTLKKKLEKTYYEEAMRYIYNAEELLKMAVPEEKYYTDLKYLKSAAGTAYAGIEKAAKWYAKLKGIELKGKNVEMIKDGLRKINKTALRDFVSLYSQIHIGMYYEDNAKIKIVKEAFDDAKEFIAYLKPYSQIAEY